MVVFTFYFSPFTDVTELKVPFKAILKELVESIPGATGAILADWEGESVEQFCLYDDYELKLIAAHKGIILSRIKEAHAFQPGGEPKDSVISTDNLHILTGVVGPDYSLVMTLDRGAIIGKALYNFRKAITRLEKEIY
jgi:predicted regulator of Ras-like GTPase activity (Roadblock/LC7/MglB family)